MKKLVNIDSSAILYILTPPMSGLIKGVEMSTGDIRYCLNRGAKVEEVLSDGITTQLTLDNYDKITSVDTAKKVEPVVEEMIEEVKEEVEEIEIEEPKKESEEKNKKNKKK